MNDNDSPLKALQSGPVHLTGIKGTGMAALAEVLHARGITLSGSDGAETFYTDELLAQIGVIPRVGFAPEHVPPQTQLLVYSAAYDETNPERQVARKRGLPQLSYFQALGLLSRDRPTLCVSGVHGKTSTTAMIGTMIRGTNVAATVVVGSAVPSFGGSATLRQGQDVLVVEACEYRRHFLEFTPAVALVTSVEWDHQDYYRTADEMAAAFREFAQQILPGGSLVYCADDPGARALAAGIQTKRSDIRMVPYGFQAPPPWRAVMKGVGNGCQTFTLGEDSATTPAELWRVSLPGEHMVVNAAGAVAALHEMMRYTPGASLPDTASWRDSLLEYRGTRRRSEVVGDVAGVLVIDDYAHHPTAIKTTLEGFASFYPERRIVVDFMSHTYSRTTALLPEFASAFAAADEVVLNDIYASAREDRQSGVDGPGFYRAVAAHHGNVRYYPDFHNAAAYLLETLKPGDLLVTMGAGDNFRVGQTVVASLKHRIEEGRRA